MQINKVGVLGCGLMGSGIAQVCATAGFDVTVLEVEQKYLDKGFAGIEKSLAKFAERPVEKGGITAQQKEAIRVRLKGTTNKADLADCDIVIEAIIENVEEKKKMYASLDSVVKKDAIFASNTSSISITKIGALTGRADRVIGMHFFNPVPVMKLVEVIRGLATSQATYETVRELAVKLEKTPVEVNDAPGFVSNRVLMPLLNEAMYAVMEGVATPEAVDEVFKLGMAHPMGPLTLADFIGLDVCLDIMRVMQDGLGDPKYRPCPLLVKMVDAGWLGRKSGRGFYKY